MGGGEKYALIGLAPYSFNFDESKTYGENFRLLQYCIALNDIHNFWLPIEEYRNLFNANYLSQKLNFEENEIVSVTPVPTKISNINPGTQIYWRDRIDKWADRNFPETRAENIKILDDYLSLCEKNNLIPIVFLPPFTEAYMKNFSHQKLDEFHHLVKEILKNHSKAVFIDGWKFKGFSDEDFLDVDHMNIQGAAKFSAILNNVIEQIENR